MNVSVRESGEVFPLHYLVTGVAGFIGSHLARALLDGGNEVTGVDSFTDYYDRSLKEANLQKLKQLKSAGSFKLIVGDVADLKTEQLSDVDVVFHQAAQAGVRKSWGESFDAYTHNNVLATQKLLEVCRRLDLQRFVYASSSSVYGEVEELPVSENTLPCPVSPYGVSKLAGEHLVNLYHYNYGLPAVSLRYFTVYGPGQRPDMAFNIFIRSIFKGDRLQVFGDGNQTRDFTYIDDAVAANLLAAEKPGLEGKIFNIGGGSRVPINRVITILEEITGLKAKIDYHSPQKGDPRHTYADTSAARRMMGFAPRVQMGEGLKHQVESLG